MTLFGGEGRRVAKEKKEDQSKRLVNDVRSLLWVVTVGGIALAFYCVHKNFTGALPWVAAMVGLPWTAHGVICAAYLNMSKSDHKAGGITFESAKANNFGHSAPDTGSTDSPSI